MCVCVCVCVCVSVCACACNSYISVGTTLVTKSNNGSPKGIDLRLTTHHTGANSTGLHINMIIPSCVCVCVCVCVSVCDSLRYRAVGARAKLHFINILRVCITAQNKP